MLNQSIFINKYQKFGKFHNFIKNNQALTTNLVQSVIPFYAELIIRFWDENFYKVNLNEFEHYFKIYHNKKFTEFNKSNEIKYFLNTMEIFIIKHNIIEKWNLSLNDGTPFRIINSFKITWIIPVKYIQKINKTIKNFWQNHQSVINTISNIMHLIYNGDPHCKIAVLLQEIYSNNILINKVQIYCNQLQKLTKYNNYVSYQIYNKSNDIQNKYIANLNSLAEFHEQFCNDKNEWEDLIFIYFQFMYSIQHDQCINKTRKRKPTESIRYTKKRRIGIYQKNICIYQIFFFLFCIRGL